MTLLSSTWESHPWEDGLYIEMAQRGHLNIKMPSYKYRNSHYIKVRWSHDSLILIMEIFIPGKTVFILKRAPSCLPFATGLLVSMFLWNIKWSFLQMSSCLWIITGEFVAECVTISLLEVILCCQMSALGILVLVSCLTWWNIAVAKCKTVVFPMC